eukprot:2274069-Amphidinium_carterae.2
MQSYFSFAKKKGELAITLLQNIQSCLQGRWTDHLPSRPSIQIDGGFDLQNQELLVFLSPFDGASPSADEQYNDFLEHLRNPAGRVLRCSICMSPDRMRAQCPRESAHEANHPTIHSKEKGNRLLLPHQNRLHGRRGWSTSLLPLWSQDYVWRRSTAGDRLREELDRHRMD